MIIKTGILHIPLFDESASQSIRLLLDQFVDDCFVTLERTVSSQRNWIEEMLRQWSDEEELDFILTIGGCYPAPGPSAEEIVPEATLAVVERQVPGLSENMRLVAQAETALAMLDRGVAGIRGRTLIVNLPAGSQASTLYLDAIVDVIEPICQHLRNAADAPLIEDELGIDEELLGTDEAGTSAEEDSFNGLNADEFAAFLRRDED